MVLLARWILENNPNARVAVITDRDELDKQIERDQVRDRIRLKHYSIRTVQAYVEWIRRFVLHHNKRPPATWRRRRSRRS
jgi:hypothetical protein